MTSKTLKNLILGIVWNWKQLSTTEAVNYWSQSTQRRLDWLASTSARNQASSITAQAIQSRLRRRPRCIASRCRSSDGALPKTRSPCTLAWASKAEIKRQCNASRIIFSLYSLRVNCLSFSMPSGASHHAAWRAPVGSRGSWPKQRICSTHYCK